jgi:hypothetical protein
VATGTVVETVAESVADELELAAVATRRIDGRLISSMFVGSVVGFGIGFYIGYKYSQRKLRNEIYAKAEEDINTIREHYQQKIIAAEHMDRPSVSELVKEKGYVTAEEADVRLLRPPVPVDEPTEIETANPGEVNQNPVSSSRRSPSINNVFRSSETEKDKDANWDYEQELANRDGDIYIIHQDEFLMNESGYAQVSYIYFSKDDVLVDEADPTNLLSNREELIGTEALKLLGHGADDHNLVHIRNDELELEFIINHVPKSWDVEVLGLDPNESG